MPTGVPQMPAEPMPAPTDVSPDDVVAAADAEGDATRAAIGAGAPQPKKPFSVKRIEAVDKQFLDTVKKLAGDIDIPDSAVWVAPPDMGTRWDQPLPADVFARLSMFAQVTKDIGAPGKRYTYSPSELVDDGALISVQGKLKLAAKDKKLAQALQGPGPDAAAPMPKDGSGEKEPPEPSETDAELMGVA